MAPAGGPASAVPSPRVETIRAFLKDLDADPGPVRRSLADLDGPDLLPFGHDGFLLNFLALFGQARGRRAVEALAAEAVRGKLWHGWEFYALLTHPERDAEGGRRIEGDAGPLRAVLESGRGALVCTHHLGDYRFVPFELARRGVRLVLPVDNDAFLQSSRALRSAAPEIQRNVEPLDVETRSGTLSLTRALRRGLPAFLYVDGNTGLGGPAAAEGRREIDFLGYRVAVKSGFARLAGRLGIPLLPMLAPRLEPGLTRWAWGPPLDPGGRLRGSDLDDFEQHAVEALYGALAAEAEKHPEQWETACFVHRWRALAGAADAPAEEADRDELQRRLDSAGVHLDLQRLVRLAREDSGDLWLDVRTLRALRLPSDLGGLVRRLSEPGPNVGASELERLVPPELRSDAVSLLQQLHQRGVLVS